MASPVNTTHFSNIKVSGSMYDADDNEILVSDLSDLSAAEMALIDGVTAGTTAASKAVSLDANQIASQFGATTTVVRVRNASGSTINKGDLVTFVGAHTDGARKIVLADANVADRMAQGAAQANIATAAHGLVIVDGLSPATLDTSAFSAAEDPVYLSETAGAVATAEETETDEISQIVGYVVVKSATVGQIAYNFRRRKKTTVGDLNGVTATAEELNETDDITSAVQSTIVVGAEAGDSIPVTVTLKDAANVAVNEARYVRCWLSSSATTGAIASDDGITVTASTGSILKEDTDDLLFQCVTSTAGVLVLDVAGAGDLTAKYLWVVMPNGQSKVSAAIDHAA